MRQYGVPYMGSKNGIAEKVIASFPKAGHFYDVFAGGCAITHATLLLGGFRHYHANDLDGAGLRLFLAAVRGEYRDEQRWISREDFERLKESDPYVRLCWSFGNRARNYLYSREIEPWKRALHHARVLGDCSLFRQMGIGTDGSRADIITRGDEYRRLYIRWWLSQQKYTRDELDRLIERCEGDIKVQEEELRRYLLGALKASGLTQREVGRRLGTQMEGHYFGRSQWSFPTEEHYRRMQAFMPLLDKDYNEVVGLHELRQGLQSLQSLESQQRLQRLQRLDSLQRLQGLETTFKDYRRLEIEPDSVIYCDPPYKGTAGYGDKGTETAAFDHGDFYRWCLGQEGLVIISEYGMPKADFACVGAVRKASLLSDKGSSTAVERLFVPRAQLGRYAEALRRTRVTTLWPTLW